MKINKKLAAAVVLAALAAVPAAMQSSQPNIVQAAKSYKIKLSHNAYIYNYRGRRVGHRVYKRGRNYRAYGTRNIRHRKYYRVGKNRYIKAANVARKAASKPLRLKDTVVTVKRKTRPLLSPVKYYKKGQKVAVDYYGLYNALGEAYYDVYRVKADHGYILAKDVKPKQKLKYVGDLDLLGRFFIEIKNSAALYDSQGQKQLVRTKDGDLCEYTDLDLGDIEVDRLLYIWVPQDQKAELFYHIKDGQGIGLHHSKKFEAIYGPATIYPVLSKGFYIKASEAELQPSIGLKPSNTAESVTPKD